MGIPIVVYPLFIGSSELPEEMHHRCKDFRCDLNDRVVHDAIVDDGFAISFGHYLDSIFFIFVHQIFVDDIIDVAEEGFCSDNRYGGQHHADNGHDNGDGLENDGHDFHSGFHIAPPSAR